MQNTARRAVKATITLLLCRALIGMRGLVTLPLFATRPEDYSILGQTLVTLAFLLPFVTLRLEIASVRFLIGETDARQRSKNFSALVLFVSSLAVVFGIAAFCFRDLVAALFYGNAEYAANVLPLACLLAISAPGVVLRSYFRIVDRVGALATVELAEAASELAVVVLLISQDFSISETLRGIVAVRASVTSAMAVAWVRPTWPVLADLKNMTKFSMPLIPNGLAAWTTSYADRLVIASVMGLTSVSIYTASFAVAAPLALVAGSVGFVLYPHLLKSWEVGEQEVARRQFHSILRWYPLIAFPVCYAVSTLSQPLLRWLAGSTFTSNSTLVFVIAIGIVVQGLTRLSNYAMHFSNTTHLITLQLALESITNVGLNLLLIPRMGLLGAALATMVSCSIGLSMSFWFCWRNLNLVPPAREAMLSGVTMCLLAGLSMQVQSDSIVHQCAIAASVVAAFGVLMLLLGATSLRELALAASTLVPTRFSFNSADQNTT